MEGVIESVVSQARNYKVEIILILIAIIVAVSSFAVFAQAQKDQANAGAGIVIKKGPTPKQNIYVDIEGAVKKPGVYLLSKTARLQNAVLKAGGLSDQADRVFFARNFNRAQLLGDQEKIYVPSIEEVESGLFGQPNQLIVAAPTPSIDSSSSVSDLININTASSFELEELPGVGPVTAEKIIQGRPYETIEELLSRKTVNSGVYEKIKLLIRVN